MFECGKGDQAVVARATADAGAGEPDGCCGVVARVERDVCGCEALFDNGGGGGRVDAVGRRESGEDAVGLDRGMRDGDIKPLVLDAASDWPDVFLDASEDRPLRG